MFHHRSGRLRVIEHIRGIESELQELGLREPDGFAHIRVKAPAPRSLQNPLAESASCSRKRILKNDLVGFGIRNGVERA